MFGHRSVWDFPVVDGRRDVEIRAREKLDRSPLFAGSDVHKNLATLVITSLQ